MFHHCLAPDPAVLEPLDPAALGELVAVDDGLVSATARVSPWHGLLLAHDPDGAEVAG